jgi:hypothetical protein
MSYGMRTGMFTGKKLPDFIKGNHVDYPGARKIINGIDKKDLIASYASDLEDSLRRSRIDSVTIPDGQAAVIPQAANRSDTEHPAHLPDSAHSTEPSPINIEKAETVINEQAAPKPSPEPVTVKTERVSIWTKIWVGITAVTGIGVNFWNIIETKINAMTPGQFGYVVGGLVLIAVALWLYDRAARRAHEKTLVKVEAAADPSKNTVELQQ